MIGFIEGKIRIVRKDSVVVDTGGVGYEVFTKNAQQKTCMEDVFFYTYQLFREDSQILYGFDSEQEYELFCLLISVKGIGCRIALNMLANMSVHDLLQAIMDSNVAALRSLPGIGAKSASQIILDLQGKMVVPQQKEKEKASQESSVWLETKEALLSLGYRPAELAGVEKELCNRNDMPLDEMLRVSLQQLARKKGI